MKTSKSVEEELEDYIWGRTKEQPFLERVVSEAGVPVESMLRRVHHIEDSLNKHIRKGVEENLPKLFEQATALEELDRTQRVVDAEVNEIFQKSEAVAKNFERLNTEYAKKYEEFKEAYCEHQLLTDVLRCLELMETFEKRTEIVKRSEIILEIEYLIQANPKLLEVIRDVVTTKLKAAQNQVRTAAAADLRRALMSLNGSLVTNAVRALSNLNCLEAELDTHLSRSIAEVEASLETLNQQGESSRALPAAMNVIQTQIEQFALLGQQYLARFCERCARSVRSRITSTAPYCLRFVQQLSRILNGLSPGVVAPLTDALKPVKKELLNQGMSNVQKLINEHDFADSHSHAFVDVLNGALLEEQTKAEWDQDMKEAFLKNVTKSLDLVASRLEKEIKLEPENLLLGDRLLAAQQANYRLLVIAALLATKWTLHAESLKDLLSRSMDRILSAVRSSIDAIFASMHDEKLGGRDTSLYMVELLAYFERIGGHCAHLGPVLRVLQALGPLVDHTLLVFLTHATLVSPMAPDVRAQLARDATRLFDACSLLHPPSLFGDARPMAMLFASDEVENLKELPVWLRIQVLIAQSDVSLKRPHQSVDWAAKQYVEWVIEQDDKDRIAFLSNLMSSYTSSVVNRGETQYVLTYPRIMALLEKGLSEAK